MIIPLLGIFMSRPINLTDLPDDLARFASARLATGRFASAEDVFHAGGEALKEREEETKMDALRAALDDGERSGWAEDLSLEGIMRDARGQRRGDYPRAPRADASPKASEMRSRKSHRRRSSCR